MKIYFVAALYQKPTLGTFYDRIVKTLLDAGHSVQHDHITGVELKDLVGRPQLAVRKYYRQALKWIAAAELVVVEASYPSTLNIGHEITLALEKGKTVIVLYKDGHNSLFLEGLHSDKLILVEYNEENLEKVLTDGLTYARDAVDSRFNFFISPRHIVYLDWVAKVKRIPRSVYLRQLIEHDRDANHEYQDEN